MDEALFKLLEQMQSNIMDKFDQVNQRFDKLEKESQKTNIAIEQDIKPKLEALFDGYTQNTKLLEDIREEVAKHEEFIIKRVK